MRGRAPGKRPAPCAAARGASAIARRGQGAVRGAGDRVVRKWRGRAGLDLTRARPLLQPRLRPAANAAAMPPKAGANTRGRATTLTTALFGGSGGATATATAASLAAATAHPGTPTPLGPSLADVEGAPGVNFALWAGAATSVTLVLLDPATRAPAAEHALSPAGGGVWALALANLPLSGVGYAYRVGGPPSPHARWAPGTLLLDPRAPLVDGRARFGARDARERFEPGAGSSFVGTFAFLSAPYDWGGDAPPATAAGKHIIYEVAVRPFTAAGFPGATPAQRGTFSGLAAQAGHLASLGVTAVELLPVFEFDELEFQRTTLPNPRAHMTNVWGYSHVSFFAPMSRFGGVGVEAGSAEFGAVARAASRELKDAVKALHAAGVAVILDVVYNHTAEGGDDDPYTLSWRGVDAGAAYMMEGSGALVNCSGCGNTVNANHPVTKALILDSLRHWVEEYRVDGFRFDLASALTRGARGDPLPDPPLVREIAEDPILRSVMLIAEPWDCCGLYQVGSFPDYGGRWGEWNGAFRDVARRFVRGDPGFKSAFATRLAGSADLYGGSGRRAPHDQVNFVIAHDGFSLNDLVSYTAKRNEANGEGGRDGSNDNFSTNCGVEGPTDDPAVLAARAKLARTHMVALFLAAGTPMVVSGDEYLQSHGGNNNWYGHDSALAWYDWGEADKGAGGFTRFLSGLARLRSRHAALGRTTFLTDADVTWHEDRWDDPESRFLAFTLRDPAPRTAGPYSGDLYAAFNAHSHSVTVPLPGPPSGATWRRCVDTNLPPPRDWTEGGNAGVETHYTLAPGSAIVLIARAA